MGSFAGDSFALLTTPDELSKDHLKSSADALEVQMFNKPRQGSTSREQLFTASYQPLTSQREDEGSLTPLCAFEIDLGCRYFGDCHGKF